MVILFVVAFLIIFSSLLYLSSNLDSSDRKIAGKRILIPLLLFFLVADYSFSALHITFINILPVIVIGCLSMYSFPVLYWLTNHKTRDSFFFPYDFMYGIYLATWLFAVEILFNYFLPNAIIVTISISLLFILCLSPIFLLVGYYLLYKKVIDYNTIQTLLYTNKKECREWFNALSGMEKISLFFIVLTTLFLLVGTIYHNSLPIISFKHLPLFAFLCAGGIFLFTVGNKALLKRTGLGVHICNFISFQKALKEYETGHKKIIAQLNVATSIPKNNFGSIVLVIGESANRDHMTAFGNYSRETTPWLSAQSKQNDFILFPNSYACFVQTASVLELALTNANQYNQINFIKSVSIIDIANLCGFNTYWYSNQGLAEKHSSSSSVIARNAQNYRWVLGRLCHYAIR